MSASHRHLHMSANIFKKIVKIYSKTKQKEPEQKLLGPAVPLTPQEALLLVT